jgi:hypothetical protein
MQKGAEIVDHENMFIHAIPPFSGAFVDCEPQGAFFSHESFIVNRANPSEQGDEFVSRQGEGDIKSAIEPTTSPLRFPLTWQNVAFCFRSDRCEPLRHSARYQLIFLVAVDNGSARSIGDARRRDSASCNDKEEAAPLACCSRERVRNVRA